MPQELALIQADEIYTSPESTEAEQQQRMFEKMATIVHGLSGKYLEAKRLRQPVEKRWLEDLRQFHGRYEPDVEGRLADDPERSKVFINLTRPKTTAWEARLWDLLFPADGKNWGINPTPVPDLGDRLKKADAMLQEHEPRMMQLVAQQNAMVDQHENPDQPDPDPAAYNQVMDEIGELSQQLQTIKRFMAHGQQVLDLAKQCATGMEREIDDQLVECRYPAISRDVIADACKLGPGVMKGPVTTNKARRKWVRDAAQTSTSTFALASGGKPRPIGRRVNPWHFFPDPEAETVDDAEYFFERHLKNRSQLIKMAKEHGFFRTAVEEVLKEGPQYDAVTDFQFLHDLQSISDEYLGETARSKYQVIEYHGPLKDEEIIILLTAMGDEEGAQELASNGIDQFAERDVVAYFCQGRMFKIAPDYPMDSGEKIYSVFSFERGEASILDAKGVPRLMRSEQAMLNSSVRMLLDNGGLSAAPQVVIDKTRVQPENGKWKMAPRKAWIKTGDDPNPNSKPFEPFNITANIQAIILIVELAEKFIDDVITMPMIAQGEQGQATGTLGGMSMLFNSANVVFRRVVKNWDDDITEPMIRRFYDWNMQFGENDEIKGDMQCEARGTSVLLVREIQSQQLMAIAMQWSTHPVIGPAVRVYETLRLTLQALAINPGDVLVSEEEFEKRLQDMAKNGTPSPEEIRAQSAMQVAQISADSRLQVAQIEREISGEQLKIEVLKLVQKDGVDMANVQALLASTKMKTDSDERKLAVETAVETENARAERAAGREPTGSGGAISMGGKKVAAA